MIDSVTHFARLSAWCLAACTLLGCQTEKTTTRLGDPLPPVPVEVEGTPSDAVVSDIVVLSPYSLSDLDGNGLASEFPIAVYLYATPYPLPFWKMGSIRVELFEEIAEGERPILERGYNAGELDALKQTNVVGRFYALQLTLFEDELRKLSNGRAAYRVTFETLSGDSTLTSSVKRINVR